MTDLQTKWIEALRSGKYKQGTGSLKSYNELKKVRFCCLGVLCNEIDPDKFLPRQDDDNIWIHWSEEHTGDILPIWLIRDIRLTYEIVLALAYANDRDVGFSEIADILEKFFENRTTEVDTRLSLKNLGIYTYD